MLLYIFASISVLTELCWFTEGFLFLHKKVCYKGLDCFSNNRPFINTLGALPQSPEKIQIKLSLFNRNHPDVGRELVYNNLSYIEQSGYDSEKPLKVIIHGFLSSGDADWVINMTQSLLLKDNVNVIVVDWNVGAHKVYNQAAANTRTVAAVTARLINVLKSNFSCDLEKVHIIGHSLGAQTAGYIGQRVPGLGRITGLDPAGPLFENYANDVKLDSSDALFVDVIHTDAVPLRDTGFGTALSCGHIDFFPNSGHHQPGCPPPYKASATDLLTFHFAEAFIAVGCSHARSYLYFTESILSSCQFTSYPCNSSADYMAGKCNTCGNGPCPVMGYNADKTNQQGTFYLSTNSKSPFCISSNESS